MDFFTSPRVLAVLSTASIVFFVASVIGIPWLIARLPEDYFCLRRARTSLIGVDGSRLKSLLRVLKNVVGAILLLAGIPMLVLPGQGLITILVAIALLDVPGKRRLLARIAARPRISAALNEIRRRRGAPPLDFESQ